MGDTLASFARTAIDIVSGSPLKLGNINFSGYEIPESISFGGTQHTSIKTLIGGKRIIEGLGAVPLDPTWSGRFQGAGAVSRARAVDAMREQGLPVNLVFGGFSYTVIIKDFHARYERSYQIPYTITCEVQSQSGSTFDVLGETLDDLVGSDALNALGLGDLIGDTTLNDALTQLQAGLTTVGTLTGSPVLAQIGGYVAGAQAAVENVSQATTALLPAIGFGVAPVGATVADSVNKLSAAVSNTMALANSTAAGNLLQRITVNLSNAE